MTSTKAKRARDKLATRVLEAEYRMSMEPEENKGNLLQLVRWHLDKRDEHLAERMTLCQALNAGAPLTGEKGIRRRLAAFDLEFFGKAYFGHYFTTEAPLFHRELDAMWYKRVMKGIHPVNLQLARQVNKQKGSRSATAAPRGHAKSTNLTFKDSAHAVLYRYKHYIIIISDSSEQAEGFLESLRVEFEENEAIREDFGKIEGDKAWNSSVLLTKSNIKIEAIGSGKKIRGRKHRNWRPDLIVVDDVENDENVRTPDQRRKLESWFTKAVSKAGDWYTDFVVIGTILHYDALLPKLLKNSTYQAIKYKAVLSFATHQELWDEWETLFTDLTDPAHEDTALTFFQENHAAMLEGTAVLWEAKNSYYDLMVQKISDGDAAFNSELQNEPINPEDCLFQEEWFDYYNPTDPELDFRDKAFTFFGFLDPSLGKHAKKGDFSAIITIARHKSTGYLYVLDADIMRRHPDQIIKDVLEKEVWLHKTYKKGYKKFGAETNQFQWFLKEELAKASARAGLYLPIVEINQTSDKTLRIQTLQPDVKNKYIKFNQQHRTLLEQLSHFPMGGHDDGPDALEGCRTVAKKSTRKFRTMNARRMGL